MPQQDAGTAEQHEAEKVLNVPFVPGVDAAEVLEPREQALNFPTSSVPAQRPAVLGLRTLASAAVGRDQSDPPLLPESRVERIAVVSAVANKTTG